MEVRLYLSLARLYVRKFVFQIDGALLGMASDLCGKLPDFPRIGHYLSPMTGPFRANIMTFRARRGARTAPSASSRNRNPFGTNGRGHRAVRGPNPTGVTCEIGSPLQRSRSALYIPTRSGHCIMARPHFAFANNLGHCRDKAAAELATRTTLVRLFCQASRCHRPWWPAMARTSMHSRSRSRSPRATLGGPLALTPAWRPAHGPGSPALR
jgi:hypothetical protein